MEPPPSAAEAQHRLGLTSSQWDRAIATLTKENLIEKTAEGYRKKDNHLYLSAARSRTSVRSFHKQMIGKALSELEKAGDKDYQRRLITGYTLALSAEQLEGLKKMIMVFLDKAAQEATQGACEEVYQLNVQLFPLTK